MEEQVAPTIKKDYLEINDYSRPGTGLENVISNLARTHEIWWINPAQENSMDRCGLLAALISIPKMKYTDLPERLLTV